MFYSPPKCDGSYYLFIDVYNKEEILISKKQWL